MKIKNLFNTGKMNKDVDERLINNGEFLDASNIRVLNTTGSDAGAVENEKGNVKLTNINLNEKLNPVCIGSVSDEAEEKIYWFIATDSNHSYIYEYDAVNEITSTVLADERGVGQVLNFDKQYKITGVNVIYNASKKTKLLLWTDNRNQPRMIDINRAKGYGVNNFYEDDISLYKKPPFKSPVVRPFNSLDKIENAVKEEFFAFGYRYRYLDGGYSATSSFSYFQFSPKSFYVNWTSMENEGMSNLFNGYTIKYNTGDHRVTDVQLLFKYSTRPNIYVIDTINKKESGLLDNIEKKYQFVNKKIYKALPQDEVFRIFDDVPLLAKAQDIINDRVVFGNTVHQYDVKENIDDQDVIKIDYDVKLESTTQEQDTIEGTISPDGRRISFDLSDFELTKDATITIVAKLESDEQGTSPNEYFQGTAICEAAFVLDANYDYVYEFTETQEFLDCITTLSNIFASVVETTVPDDDLDLIYGSFTYISSTENSFTIEAPENTHIIDDTPADDTDNDDPNFQTNLSEPFKFTSSTKLRFKKFISNISLKSIRSYEVGLCYLDSYGRYSSVLLPKEAQGETSSEVFVPVSKSTFLNKLKITLNNKPPYWANRYKWFVKVNKGLHYNLYATIFYQDGVYRWILLQGANLGKLEEGKNLIVKADDNGPLDKVVKTKILEVRSKNDTDEMVQGQGWIDGNVNAQGDNLIEKAGTYVKIRPNGFKMDFKPDNFIVYEDDRNFGDTFGDASSGVNEIFIPSGARLAAPYLLPPLYSTDGGGVGISGCSSTSLQSLLGIDTGCGSLDTTVTGFDGQDTSTWQFRHKDITPGTLIELEFSYSENQGAHTFSYSQSFVSNNLYQTTYDTQDAEQTHALIEFFDNETSFSKTVIGEMSPDDIAGGYRNAVSFKVPAQQFNTGTSGDAEEHFNLIIAQSGPTVGNGGYARGRWVMIVQPSENTAAGESSYMAVKIEVTVVENQLVFETEPEDIDDDIYYETEETFEIINGLHKGNNQDQTDSLPAISTLGFGNCFSFGNGVESVRALDDRFKPELNIKSRPNIAIIEGYERKEDENKLIYSGAFNENTGYNTLNEFNQSRGITKYMDIKYGSIQKLFSRESDLIVFQEDRVSKVLYGKNILTSPDGSGSVSQIEKVLGQDVPFSGEYGISTNPESFANFEGRMYFTDATRGTVLRLGGDGMTPISYAGMRSWFKENLYNNKTKFNIGGFDPKYHQYVISMSDENQVVETLELHCASEFVRILNSAFSYNLNVGEQPGTLTIDYTTTSSINIVIEYAGNTYTNNGLTGTGQVTFNVSSSDLDTTDLATVTITPASSAQVNISHTCPVPPELEIVLIVVNDSTEAGETIVNRYKHDGVGGGSFNSDFDVFESDELTRYEIVTGVVGSQSIPGNGDTITLSSFKDKETHTGDFNSCNRLGYLVSASTGLTLDNILAQATYLTTSKTETSLQEENSASFVFNTTNSSEKLYLIWDYQDSLPVLVDDIATGIANGGTTTINVLSNDTVTAPYTVTLGSLPSNGTAVVNADNTITYTHTSGADLLDSFTYIVTIDGNCQAEATVTTNALSINSDTYIYIYFDASGSMNTTLADLRTLKDGALKATLQDLYATGQTEGQGNTDTATNGSDDYDSHVTIVYEDDNDNNTNWSNERTFAAVADPDVDDFIASGTQNNFPADAGNVIVMVFQDEASAVYHDSRNSGTFDPINDNRTAGYNLDMANLRTRVAALNNTDANFYRGVVFHVEDVQGVAQYPFRAFLQAIQSGTGNYSGTNGLSDLMSGVQPTFDFVYNVEDSTGNNATSPFKPGSTIHRFDQWQYYYLYHITDALNTLGFTPGGENWPVIIDD